MLRPSMVKDMTAPYSAAESWLYDRVVADAVVELKDAMWDRLGEDMPDDARVLDVGCGGGQLAVHIAERWPRARVTGLDLSEQQVGRARKRAEGLGDRLRFVQGSALELPFGDDSFDVVLSIASIKHWSDPAEGLAECVRVLVPGGKLVVVEADRGCRLEDAEGFVRRFRVPGPLQPLALMAFRTWVAGRSLDLEDARELAEPLPLVERTVERVAGAPALAVVGRK